ncbi:MAG: thrombospondin type 3 repeat-containing protein [Proteobacteria bacterium]|nr:thrombospondin type 3 repeat-containing protein [Pseudomonadota bacterium]
MIGPCSVCDSVDAEGGPIDGEGQGRSLFQPWGEAGITIVFDRDVLGGLPSAVGIVWTDGTSSVTIEAVAADGQLLGPATGDGHADGSFYGETGEDRFYGIIHRRGITEFRISVDGGAFEVDHLQYGDIIPASALDSDGDGLSDGDEDRFGTDPGLFDTDRDGLGDADELVAFGTDPVDPDSDDDSLSDGDELASGTDPGNPDSDGDSVSDGDEVARGTDPLHHDSIEGQLRDELAPFIRDIDGSLFSPAARNERRQEKRQEKLRQRMLDRVEAAATSVVNGKFRKALGKLVNLHATVDSDDRRLDWLFDSAEKNHVRAEIERLLDVLTEFLPDRDKVDPCHSDGAPGGEQPLSGLLTVVCDLDRSVFDAPSDKLRERRRKLMARRIVTAARKAAKGKIERAIDKLFAVHARVDDELRPRDWIGDWARPEKERVSQSIENSIDWLGTTPRQ